MKDNLNNSLFSKIFKLRPRKFSIRGPAVSKTVTEVDLHKGQSFLPFSSQKLLGTIPVRGHNFVTPFSRIF